MNQRLLKSGANRPKNDRYRENHKKLSLVLITIIGVASAQAGTVHAGHTTVHTGGHGNYHGNYHGGQRYANGTTLTGVKGTTPTEVTAPVAGTVGIMVANITTAATTHTMRPSL
jgi:hypothetical protein